MSPLLNTSRAPAPSRFFIAAITLLPLAACSNGGDDDDDGGGNHVEGEFGAALDATDIAPAPVHGTRVRVTITNRAPANGTNQTPVWMGFHDGGFDTFDLAASADTYFPVGMALERLAEDGDPEPLSDAFTSQSFGRTQGVAHGVLASEPGILAPGETTWVEFELDPAAAENRYFSYASMVIPSNDAFVANDLATAHEVFDAGGNFVASDFVVLGSAVLDAGTEVNDENPNTTTFFGQTGPNSGIPEGGTVQAHVGFHAAGMGGILDDPEFADADFTAPGYAVLEFHFEEVPATAPATGVARIEQSANGSSFAFTIGAAGLTGSATAVHLHRAAPGMSGPILVNLSDAIVTDASGTLTIDDTFPSSAELDDALRAGEVYVDVHTTLNVAGELRGTIEASETFTAELGTDQEVPAPVAGRDVRVTVTNAAPEMGTFQTPVWIGFHDGNFDTHDIGAPAIAHFPGTNAMEPLSEDGDTFLLVGAFTIQAHGRTQGVLAGVLGPEPGPIAPGESVSRVFRLDPSAPTSEYFSYASMIIPSNDAFTSNGGGMDVPIYSGGTFVGADFTVMGSSALDAGTEVNDEIPLNTEFFGQTTSNTGMTEGGIVLPHVGYMAPGGGGVLDDPMFANADFQTPGYELLRLRFTESEPGPAAHGLVIALLSDDESELTIQVFAEGLSGPATAMHLHEGAVGEAGPVIVTLTSSIQQNSGGVLSASSTSAIDAGMLASLRAGGVYLNIHTSLNPMGEIRGQLTLAD